MASVMWPIIHHSDHLSVEGIVCQLIVTGPVYEVLSLHDDVATHPLVHTGLKGPRGEESDKTKEINKELSTGFSTKLKFQT